MARDAGIDCLKPAVISYREHAPPPFLSPWVRCLWELAGDARDDGAPPRLERVLPDGCMEWVFHAGEPFRIETERGLERQAPALLVGVTTRAVRLEPSRRVDVLGVRFRPGGASAFLRAPAAAWRDRVAPLEEADDRAL